MLDLREKKIIDKRLDLRNLKINRIASSIDEQYGLQLDLRGKLLKQVESNKKTLDLRGKINSMVKKIASYLKDFRKTAAVGVEIGPIEVERKQISNRGNKIEIRRDGELLGDLKYETYPERNLLYVNYVEIGERYRQNGLAMLLYKEFSQDYNENYQGWKIRRTFINPVAEYAFSKAVLEGYFPEDTLTNGIKRDYNQEEQELWDNELQPKLVDLRNKNQQTV